MENKPKMYSLPDGTEYWTLGGIYHREDGPALIRSNGYKVWYVHGVPHRLDGPAVIFPEGIKEWNINGLNATDIITDWANENDIDLDNLSEVDKALIKIVWADYGKT